MSLTASDIAASPLFDDEWSVERVRQTRRQLDDDRLADLLTRLEYLQGAVAAGNLATAERIVQRCPPGKVRDCLADLVDRYLRGRDDTQISAAGPLARGALQRRARPTYSQINALVAPVDVWACTGIRHLILDPDCFWGMTDTPFEHTPVGLQWRHTGKVVGLSRRWALDDDGSLHGSFWIPDTPAGQAVAQAAADRIVYPSIGVRFVSDWVHPLPDEWDPNDGVLDWCTHRYATVEEVSLTPTPQLPTAIESVF